MSGDGRRAAGPTEAPVAADPGWDDDEPTVRSAHPPMESAPTHEIAELVAFTGPTLAQRVFGRWLGKKGVDE